MATKNVPYCYPVRIMNGAEFVRIDLFVLIPLDANFSVIPNTPSDPKNRSVLKSSKALDKPLGTSSNSIKKILGESRISEGAIPSTHSNSNVQIVSDRENVRITYALGTTNRNSFVYFYDRIKGVNTYNSNVEGFNLHIRTDTIIDYPFSLFLKPNNYNDFDIYEGPETDVVALNCPYLRLHQYLLPSLKFFPELIIPNQDTNYKYVPDQSYEQVLEVDASSKNYSSKVILQLVNTLSSVPEEATYIDDNVMDPRYSEGDFVVEVIMRDISGNPTDKVKKGKVKNKASAGVVDPGTRNDENS